MGKIEEKLRLGWRQLEDSVQNIPATCNEKDQIPE
jgi:hypothetical protein